LFAHGNNLSTSFARGASAHLCTGKSFVYRLNHFAPLASIETFASPKHPKNPSVHFFGLKFHIPPPPSRAMFVKIQFKLGSTKLACKPSNSQFGSSRRQSVFATTNHSQANIISNNPSAR
jgi:hypothetical protein